MAEALKGSELLSPIGHRSLVPVSCKRANPSFAGFPRSSPLENEFLGANLVVKDGRERPSKGISSNALSVQMKLSIAKAMKWWEKGLQPNMKEITSAQDLVDSLLNAGNKLVVVDFFLPGCGGCKALHPKICQFAEMNPEVQFLQVNYGDHKSMAYSLNVHVLPFFRFYRGAHGRLCSFSCTNATIKKFKDAIAKHGTDRCSLGPAKGLEESELAALAVNKELSFNYTRKTEEKVHMPDAGQEMASPSPKLPVSPEKSLAGAGI